MFLVLATLVIGLLFLIDYYNRQYWKRKGVIQTPSVPFFGHLLPVVLQQSTKGGVYDDVSKKTIGKPYVGIYEFLRPVLVVNDINLIEHILIKDFANFLDRPRWIFDDRSTFKDSLFNMKGDRWRALRYQMIPWFTTGRMKILFPDILNCVYIPEGEFEASEYVSEVAADTITTFFDVQVCDKKKLQEMNKSFHEVNNLRYYKLLLIEHFPQITEPLGITLSSHSTNEYFKNMSKFFIANKNYSLAERFQKILNQKVVQLRKKDLYSKLADDEVYTFEVNEDILRDIAAQFFSAGLDTTSNTVIWLIYELAMHPDVQTKAREEIRTTLNKHGGWTYEAIHDMKYVASCANESMRLHPTISFIFRSCTTQYTTPDGLTIEKGTKILIPSATIHTNPNIYEDPELFKPERFGNIEKQTNLVWLPFGEGPRKCLGMKFSQMEQRIMVAKLLENHEIVLSEKTKLPVVNNDKLFLARPLNKIFLKLRKVD